MKKSLLFALIAMMVLTALVSGCQTTSDKQSAGATGDEQSPMVSAQGQSPEVTVSPDTSATPEAAEGVVNEEDVAYAGPMVDNVLTALENRDYEAFGKDLGDTMKTAMTKEAFNALAELLTGKVGSYEQAIFGEGANVTQSGVAMTVIVYKAKYSDEPGDVLVTVTFSREGEKKIIGLYFNSPKLREQ